MPPRKGSKRKRKTRNVICVSDSAEFKITKGKTYEILDALGDSVFIKNDEGKTIPVNTKFFMD